MRLLGVALIFLYLSVSIQAGELPKSSFQLCLDQQAFCLINTENVRVKTQLDVYQEALAEAKRRNCPLVVWCNRECVPCRSATQDCVHVSVTNIEGDTAPCVYVAVNNNGVYSNCGAITGPINSSVLRSKIDETKRAVEAARPKAAAPVQYVPQEQYQFSAPQMQFFGGGGRFSGGSCRGGG